MYSQQTPGLKNDDLHKKVTMCVHHTASPKLQGQDSPSLTLCDRHNHTNASRNASVDDSSSPGSNGTDLHRGGFVRGYLTIHALDLQIEIDTPLARGQ